MTAADRHVEIVGVAGTGKSTLTRLLCDRGAIRADILHTRRPSHWPYVARAIPSVAPMLASVAASGRRPCWDEVKYALYAASWDGYLGARATDTGRLVVLDQGPIFALARILWGESRLVRAPAFEEWAEQTVRRWAGTLDAIVWLDASDDVLLQRIDGRAQPHEVKRIARGDALDVLSRHRAAYAAVRAPLLALGAPLIVDLDTSCTAQQAIAAEVERVLGEVVPNAGARGDRALVATA